MAFNALSCSITANAGVERMAGLHTTSLVKATTAMSLVIMVWEAIGVILCTVL